jgi:5-methylcytosine-specific restriction endonuclease McrA
VYGLLESNDVNLSTMAMVSKILNADNKDVVLSRMRGKSQKEVKKIVAEYDPRARVPLDRIEPMTIAPETVAAGMSLLDAVSGAVTGRTDETRAEDPEQAPASEHDRSGRTLDREIEPPAPAETFFRIQFSASEAFMGQLERFRALTSHRLAANASLEQVFALAMGYFIEREDATRRHQRRARRTEERSTSAKQWNSLPQQQSTAGAKPVAPRLQRRCAPKGRRPLPAVVRDAVFVRDQGKCTFVGTNGKRCGSAHVLQVDHVRPVALGGNNAPENLRLLCAHHNRCEAERLMGPWMNRDGPGR